MRIVSMMAAAALAALPVSALAVEAPKVSIASLAELPRPLPMPYDDGKGDSRAALDAAFARAKAADKRVMVQFGANWCGDCRVLSAVTALPEVSAFVDRHFEVVKIDVGRFDRNLDLVRRMGVEKLSGVPTVVIATAEGRALNVSNSADLADARSKTPQGIADWLAQYAK